MFGSIGLPELLILGVLAALATLFGKRGALGVTGPVLVLRKFEVNQAGPVAVRIEGRSSGFVAWLLTTLGVDTLTTLTATADHVYIRQASLSGEIHRLAPSTRISSTHCGYTQPIWLLILGGSILLLSMLMALGSDDAAQIFVGGILLAGMCGVIYLLQRKIALTVETSGGMVMGLAFKPSVIENVSVDLARALQAIDCINRVVIGRSMPSLEPIPEVAMAAAVTSTAEAMRPASPVPAATAPRCPSCLAEILDPGSTFCGSCGARLMPTK